MQKKNRDSLTAVCKSWAARKFQGLLEAFQLLGWTVRVVQVAYEALVDVPLPVIAYMWDNRGRGKFVLVCHVTKDSVVIADGDRGARRLSRRVFCNCWSGIILMTGTASKPSVHPPVSCRSPPHTNQERVSSCYFSPLLPPRQLESLPDTVSPSPNVLCGFHASIPL